MCVCVLTGVIEYYNGFNGRTHINLTLRGVVWVILFRRISFFFFFFFFFVFMWHGLFLAGEGERRTEWTRN